MPTQSEIEEVGERLVELERRQHRVEEKLDRILEAVE
jgi:predicted nuclease with TOPRIM domain